MSDTLGPMRFGQPQSEVFLGRDIGHSPDYSDEVAGTIDDEVRRLIQWAHEAAREILETNRAVLDGLAVELIAHETLETERGQQIFNEVRPWDGAVSDGTGRASAAAASDNKRSPRPRKGTE
jgi:cell division protease FtsH